MQCTLWIVINNYPQDNLKKMLYHAIILLCFFPLYPRPIPLDCYYFGFSNGGISQCVLNNRNCFRRHRRRKAGKRPYLNDDMRRPSLNFDELPAEDISKQLVHLCWKGVKKVPVCIKFLL